MKPWRRDPVTHSQFKEKFMQLKILPIGTIDSEAVSAILQGLGKAFPRIECNLLKSVMQVPEDAYNQVRRQYNSSQMLAKITEYVRDSGGDIVLGVTQVDIYASNLNFVFGEAQCPGKLALISLFRLRPEFYGRLPDKRLFYERAVKEAVHEVGHTLGLRHCQDSSCVMFFSNSILDTDAKRATLCKKCSDSAAEHI